MSKLRIPSLQHLARNWRETPEMTQRGLVNLVNNPPIFNYNALFKAVDDLLILNVPYDQVVNGIRMKVSREGVRNNFLGVLPLIRDHFEGINPDYVLRMDRSFYPAGRDLLIPFEPPFIYGVGGQVYFPWLSFWRSNPLAKKRLSFFITIVEEMLLQEPDLENARFQILDFSSPTPKEARHLTVLEADEIPRLDEHEKNAMLEVFVEGYFLAQAELAGMQKDTSKSKDQPAQHDPNQYPLF